MIITSFLFRSIAWTMPIPIFLTTGNDFNNLGLEAAFGITTPAFTSVDGWISTEGMNKESADKPTMDPLRATSVSYTHMTLPTIPDV